MKKRLISVILTIIAVSHLCMNVSARDIDAGEPNTSFMIHKEFGLSDLVMNTVNIDKEREGASAEVLGFTFITDTTSGKIVQEDDGNKCISFQASDSSKDAYMRLDLPNALTGVALIEMDIKIPTDAYYAQLPTLQGFDRLGNMMESIVCTVNNGRRFTTSGGANNIVLKPNTWNRISIAADLNNKAVDIYVNGTRQFDDITFYKNVDNIKYIKFLSRNVGYEFLIDNIKYGVSENSTVVDEIEDNRVNYSITEEMRNFTKEDIAAQREAGDRLYEDIQNAINEGLEELQVQDGWYRFGRGKYPNLTINGAKNLHISGNNVNILQEASKVALQIQNCKNLTIDGFKIDYINPPVSQGTIINVNKDEQSIIYKIDQGYRIPDQSWLNQRVFVYAKDAHGDYTVPLKKHCNDKIKSIERIGNDVNKTIKIKTTRGDLFSSPETVSLMEDCKVVIPLRAGSQAVRVEDSDECVFNNMEIYSAPTFALYESSGKGGHTYNGLKIIRRPGTDRLLTSCADAFHSSNCEFGAKIIDSEISYAEDDLLNINNATDFVYDIVDKKTMIIVSRRGIDAQPGTEAEFYDFETYDEKGKATVVSCQKIINEKISENVIAIPSFVAGEYGVTIRDIAIGTFDLYLVTVDREVDILPYDWIIGTSTGQKNALIKNTYFHHGFCRGALIKGPDTVIEDCTFDTIGNCALYVHTSPYWLEGPIPNNLIVKNNQFNNICYGTANGSSSVAAINVLIEFTGLKKDPYKSTIYNNVKITNNKIDKCQTAAICVLNSINSEISNNDIKDVFVDWYGNPDPNSQDDLGLGNYLKGLKTAVFAEDCSNMSIFGNTYQGIPAECANEKNLSTVK